eukprot:COSAG03_NODE_914_length_5353_cov_33.767606_6_plen_248_part_00
MPDYRRALCPVRRGVITGIRPYARYQWWWTATSSPCWRTSRPSRLRASQKVRALSSSQPKAGTKMRLPQQMRPRSPCARGCEKSRPHLAWGRGKHEHQPPPVPFGLGSQPPRPELRGACDKPSAPSQRSPASLLRRTRRASPCTWSPLSSTLPSPAGRFSRPAEAAGDSPPGGGQPPAAPPSGAGHHSSPKRPSDAPRCGYCRATESLARSFFCLLPTPNLGTGRVWALAPSRSPRARRRWRKVDGA